jgi:hypothetical protein
VALSLFSLSLSSFSVRDKRRDLLSLYPKKGSPSSPCCGKGGKERGKRCQEID